MSAVRLKYEQACPECGSTDSVDDRSAGDLICKGCGLVLEAHAIDESSEWRTFADADSNAADPNRVGGPLNELLTDGGLATGISDKKGGGSKAALALLQRAHNSGKNPDRALMKAFSEMGKICDQLKLVRTIKDRANQIFKEISGTKVVKGRRLSGVYTAVVYCACKDEQHPRSFKEILTVVQDVSAKDVTKAYKLIVQQRGQPGHVASHPADLIRRFGHSLSLAHRDCRAAEELAEAAKPREDGTSRPDAIRRTWDGRTPLSVAGAIILLITRLPGASLQPSPAEVAQAVHLAEGTIRSTYSEMLPDVAHLIPTWFASQEAVQALLKGQ